MTSRQLKISTALSLPVGTMTDTLAVLAVKGSGKTYTFLVMAEEMIKRGLPVIILDPVGVCWGLRTSADGMQPGLAVIILGGQHGDAPLESTAGQVIADFVIETRQAVVLDFSSFETRSEQIQFTLDFLTRLYRGNREPLHVIIDEADDVAPQKPFGDEARVLRAVEILVRRGRARGLGVTLVTQRSAVLSKNVLTQIGTLIVGRTTSPQDRKAIETWVDAHGLPEQKRELMSSLASLPANEKWVWSPGQDIFQRVVIRPRETFDSSATPRVGMGLAQPKKLAEVDLDALRARIAATVARAEADDPKVLRARIAELHHQAKTRSPVTVEVVKEVPFFDPEVLDGLTAASKQISLAAESIDRAIQRAREIMAVAPAPSAEPVSQNASPNPSEKRHRETGPVESSRTGSTGNKCERALLVAIVRRHPASSTVAQVAILSGYSATSSSVGNALGALRSSGLVEGGRAALRATEAGVLAAGVVERLLSGPRLLEQSLQKLDKCERALLNVLANAYPERVPKDVLAERSGYSVTSSSMGNALGKLRALELVDRDVSPRASDSLMQPVGRNHMPSKPDTAVSPST